jgi:GNAT superfamily N-acetyltransferase
MSDIPFNVRTAVPDDVSTIAGLIGELAEFEALTHLLQLTDDKLMRHLFGDKPVVEALVAERQGKVVGYALYFTNFSTFLAQPGLYLEDLYVQPAHRRHGIATALLQRLAHIAVDRDYGRFEWSVLDWNVNAIGFYEKIGASVLPEWRICRMTGAALAGFAKNVDQSNAR